ncbi:MAG: glycosyltransferase family 4 protein [Chloroflexi bacterium]|nr:glycosyltransferase family 4 protein [Chloroflexota bacterium]
MRIAIDARLNAYRTGGIPQYTRQLLRAMAEIAPEQRFVALNHRKAAAPIAQATNIAQRYVWTPPHHRWEQIALPLELASVRADVFHFPDFIPLFRLRRPTAITIHDLAFMRYPEILDAAARRYYGQIHQAVARADAIIAVSESTRRDIAELLDIDPERVDVVREAAAPQFQPLALPPDAERRINGHVLRRDRFALFVGTLEPRKNLPTLLRALHQLAEQPHDDPPTLVIAGPRGWLDDDIAKLVAELRLTDIAQFIGGVETDDLIWLYNACRVYLHPELYSGFGLPILEAMQCGAPVISADNSSLPEVAGAAARLLPAQDVAAWAAAWSSIWHDRARREQMREAGRQQAQRFSWSTAAQETLSIYARIAGRR